MRFTDDARRARLARRHGLHPGHRLDDPMAVARAMTALHATEAASVHLAVAARMNDPDVGSVEEALYEDRSLVKQLAMRRTLFAAPRDLLPALLGSASARVAAQQRSLLAQEVERHGIAPDGAAWIARASAAVLERLSDGSAVGARQLRGELPELDATTTPGPGAKKWDVPVNLGPRLLTLLGAEGLIVRAGNEGHWRTSRPTWTRMESWLGVRPEPLDPRAGYAELVRRYLTTFGPASESDVVWWLGATKAAVRAALTDLDAVPVTLDSGATGFVLPGDEAEDADVGPWASLLPVLDPTVMGWKERGAYLDPAHVPYLFDSNGNAGTTAWLDGRIVGCWVQDGDARVRVVPTGRLATRDLARLEVEAERLTAFLDGVVISSVYKSRQMKGEPLP
ncbi:MAG TPA: winged helix DNA-binding domain-containing protein [Propionibacterium sp.]|nr:winged helix DNA-binding domain-containing protein [Propionibacterium sp.]